MALSDRLKGEIVEAVLAAANKAYEAGHEQGRADERAAMAERLGLTPPVKPVVERVRPKPQPEEDGTSAAKYGGITAVLRAAFAKYGHVRVGVGVSDMFDHAREWDRTLDDVQLRTALKALLDAEEIERVERGFYKATDKLKAAA